MWEAMYATSTVCFAAVMALHAASVALSAARCKPDSAAPPAFSAASIAWYVDYRAISFATIASLSTFACTVIS